MIISFSIAGVRWQVPELRGVGPLVHEPGGIPSLDHIVINDIGRSTTIFDSLNQVVQSFLLWLKGEHGFGRNGL
jgi:hypothetical protein